MRTFLLETVSIKPSDTEWTFFLNNLIKLSESFLEAGGDLESFNVYFFGSWILYRISKQ